MYYYIQSSHLIQLARTWGCAELEAYRGLQAAMAAEAAAAVVGEAVAAQAAAAEAQAAVEARAGLRAAPVAVRIKGSPFPALHVHVVGESATAVSVLTASPF